MRGDNYIWSDGSGVHFWSANGRDYWEVTGWHVDDDEHIREEHQDEKGEVTASGVYLPNDIVDQFVLMRFAELFEEGRFPEVLKMLQEGHFNPYHKEQAARLGKVVEQSAS
jgi:hypothetical protein